MVTEREEIQEILFHPAFNNSFTREWLWLGILRDDLVWTFNNRIIPKWIYRLVEYLVREVEKW